LEETGRQSLLDIQVVGCWCFRGARNRGALQNFKAATQKAKGGAGGLTKTNQTAASQIAIITAKKENDAAVGPLQSQAASSSRSRMRGKDT
jgi:hypothetical protein